MKVKQVQWESTRLLFAELVAFAIMPSQSASTVPKQLWQTGEASAWAKDRRTYHTVKDLSSLAKFFQKKKTQQNNTQVWEHIHGEQSLGKGVPGWGIKVKHKTRCREWCSGYHNIILTVRLMNYRNSSLNLQWFHHHRKCFFFFFFFFYENMLDLSLKLGWNGDYFIWCCFSFDVHGCLKL